MKGSYLGHETQREREQTYQRGDDMNNTCQLLDKRDVFEGYSRFVSP